MNRKDLKEAVAAAIQDLKPSPRPMTDLEKEAAATEAMWEARSERKSNETEPAYNDYSTSYPEEFEGGAR